MNAGVDTSAITFQLTTSRGGRRGSLPYCNSAALFISTHDLTRRLTVIAEKLYSIINISTHDLARRSTAAIEERLPSGSISTHDLARRSTFHSPKNHCISMYFNSRPRKEVDRCTREQRYQGKHFNSRPRKEVDWYGVEGWTV